MQRRRLGRTGLDVSVIGFGCGTVGGLMTRGDPAEQERAIGLALDLGINYFDTAAQYGEGQSEINLGRVLAKLKPDIILATKVKVPSVERKGIGPAIVSSLEASLNRLGRDRVDLLQLHNTVAQQRETGGLTSDEVLTEAIPAFERLQRDGKIGHFGMTALGETAALSRVVDSGRFVSAQVAFNLLNPSAARAIAPGYPAQDYQRLLPRMEAAGMSGVCIRIMAAGALSGVAAHPLARGGATPMGSGSTFAADQERARRFERLVADGHAESLAAAAIRYATGAEGIATVLIGASGPEQVGDAARAAAAGSLSPEALRQVEEIQNSFVGEPR